MERDETIKRIHAALKERSGKTWSVTGGRGTAWAWITIDAPPARRTWHYRLKAGCVDAPENYKRYDSFKPGGTMGPADQMTLARLLALESVHFQGHDIPAATDYRIAAVERAEGKPVTVEPKPYWD